jgi:hypothetical protein
MQGGRLPATYTVCRYVLDLVAGTYSVPEEKASGTCGPRDTYV